MNETSVCFETVSLIFPAKFSVSIFLSLFQQIGSQENFSPVQIHYRPNQ
jgi:hypothetical protein